jgi:serine/threonine-protein kinase
MNRSQENTVRTVADGSGAFDATMASPESVSQPVSVRASTRSTVLPRVEGTGAAATIVTASRPRFQHQGGLGEGGMGEVVAALDHDIGREVAIKRLRPEAQGTSGMVRFLDEIRTVGSLEHPNIVPIHDVGVDENGALYFVMRKVQGETLETILEKINAGDPIAVAHYTFEKRVHIFRQLLEAVAFAHGHGIVHRDIKPANVMVGHFGEVFLMDWGIAKPLDQADRLPHVHGGAKPLRVTETHTGAIVGTPAYMSPEQARGEKVDFRSDTYSLSVLFYEWLGLRHYLSDHVNDSTTIEGLVVAVQTTEPTPLAFLKHPSPHQPPVPAELSWYCVKGLKKDPAERFQTVREMIERLDLRDEGIFPVQCPITFSKQATSRMTRFIDRHPNVVMMMLSVFALFLLAGLAGGGWAIWHHFA